MALWVWKPRMYHLGDGGQSHYVRHVWNTPRASSGFTGSSAKYNNELTPGKGAGVSQFKWMSWLPWTKKAQLIFDYSRLSLLYSRLLKLKLRHVINWIMFYTIFGTIRQNTVDKIRQIQCYQLPFDAWHLFSVLRLCSQSTSRCHSLPLYVENLVESSSGWN